MEKKTKLKISGIAKKSIQNIEKAKTQGKNSVIIEKQSSKFSNKSSSFKSSFNKPKSTSSFNRGAITKPGFASKVPQTVSDFCLLYTSPSPRDSVVSRMPSSA